MEGLELEQLLAGPQFGWGMWQGQEGVLRSYLAVRPESGNIWLEPVSKGLAGNSAIQDRERHTPCPS